MIAMSSHLMISTVLYRDNMKRARRLAARSQGCTSERCAACGAVASHDVALKSERAAWQLSMRKDERSRVPLVGEARGAVN
jgi:hypothetical protein